MTINFITSKQKYYYLGLPSSLNVRSGGGLIGAAGGLIFSILDSDSGYSNLSTTLQINEQTVEPMFNYRGHLAASSSWTASVGTNLSTIDNGGTNLQPDKYTPFTTSTERAVKLEDVSDNKYYQAPNNNFSNIGTDDFIFEAIIKKNTSEALDKVLFSKYSISQLIGYVFAINGLVPRIYMRQSGSVVSHISSITLSINTWNHIMAFGNRNGNLRWYINGIYNSQSDLSADQGTVDSNTPLEIGHLASSSAPRQNYGSGEIAWLSAWIAPDLCGGTVTEQNAIVSERFAKLTGFYASTAGGTAYPVFNRATPAYLDRFIDETTGERRLFYVGNDWPRLARRKESTSGSYVTGFLSEKGTLNRLLRSEDFNTTWIKETGTDSITVNAAKAPNGNDVADGFVPDTQNISHRIYQEYATFVSGSTYTYSCFAKKGSADFLGLYVSQPPLSNGFMFNIASGTIGGQHFNSQWEGNARIESYGNGWYRCSITWQMNINNLSSINMYPSKADWTGSGTATHAFPGNGSISTYLWGAQLEISNIATNYVPTVGSVVVKNVDNLIYSGSGNTPIGAGTFEIQTLVSGTRFGSYEYATIGESVNNRITFFTTGSAGLNIKGDTGGITQWDFKSGSNVNDNNIHTFVQSFENNSIKGYLDGVNIGTDLVASPITSSAFIYVGQSYASSLQTNGLISNLKLYNTIVTPDRFPSWPAIPTGQQTLYSLSTFNTLGTMTATSSSMGATLNSRWIGGVLGSDGKIYGIPFTPNDILIIDPNSDTAIRSTMGATLTGSGKWCGGVLGTNGKIYCMPYDSTSILAIDPILGTSTTTSMGATLTGSAKFYGGVLGRNGKIYGMPVNSNDMLIVDTTLETATRNNMGINISSHGSAKWHSGVLAPNGKIYCIPGTATSILIIDTIETTATAILSTMGASLAGGGAKWVTGILAPNGKIYCIPYDATDILIIDPILHTATRSNMGADLSGAAKWNGGVLGPDGKIYGIPDGSINVLIIDPVAGTATRSAMGASYPGTNKWNGGILASNGKIYGIPNTATNILMISSSLNSPVDINYVLQPALNKL